VSGQRVAPASARQVALAALLRVTEDQAYAAAVLSQWLDPLPAVERALATELCYGVLRAERYLQRRVERHADLARTDPEVLLVLLLCTYQLEFLDRIPAHAAVSESVELLRGHGRFVTGFANAVLRKLASDVEGRLPREEAILSSVPAWLRKRLERSVGAEAARALLVPTSAPRSDLRQRPGRPLPADVALEALPGPGAFRMVAGGDLTRLPGHARGDFQIQEFGSQCVARLAGARPGERVLDACAGRGQKTMCFLDTGAVVLATDVHEHKLRALEGELGRYGLSAPTRVVDFTQEPPSELVAAFDVVLLDAPCTGTGTLRRRPEIARRLSPDSPRELAELQTALLRQAARCVAPGGRLVYSTCSVLADEAERVLEAVSDVLVPVPLSANDALVDLGLAVGASSVRLLPTTTGSDGYFVAELAPGRV
jgi:16S rRNA (cytosine967-C5)-methyltransferase